MCLVYFQRVTFAVGGLDDFLTYQCQFLGDRQSLSSSGWQSRTRSYYGFINIKWGALSHPGYILDVAGTSWAYAPGMMLLHDSILYKQWFLRNFKNLRIGELSFMASFQKLQWLICYKILRGWNESNFQLPEGLLNCSCVWTFFDCWTWIIIII